MKSLQDSSFNISLYSLRYMSLSPRIIEEFRYNTYIYILPYLTLPGRACSAIYNTFFPFIPFFHRSW